MGPSTSLKLDSYNRPVLTVDQGVDLMLAGKSMGGVIFEDENDIDLYNRYSKDIVDHEGSINKDKYAYITSEQFHGIKTHKWMMPEKYVDMDIEDYVLSLCDTSDEKERVTMELSLFNDRGMYDLLRLLVYVVDHFRENNYVWGVGRGSSVSSYCLFLIGVHKVDSLKYNLDIREFLK